MSDEKTRRGHMTDEDRALQGLAHRRASTVSDGIPRVANGGDSTPLPMEPRPLGALASIDDVRAKLEEMHNVQREQDIAIARMWDARKLGDEVTRLAAMLGGLSDLAGVPELLRIQSYKIGQLLSWRDTETKASEKRDEKIDTLDRKIDDIEKAFVRTTEQISALSTRIGDVFSSLTKRVEGVGDELAALEKRIEDEIEKLSEAVKASETRIISLERDRTIVKAWAALIAFLAGIAGWMFMRWQSGQK